MNYELFKKAASLNGEFEIVPEKVSLLAKGIVLNNQGHMEYKGQTYLTNIVTLSELPIEIHSLFLEKKLPSLNNDQNSLASNEPKDSGLEDLNKILKEQLQNIVDPEEGKDEKHELKKAKAVCDVADKIIKIADLSLKAKIFYHKQK